MQTIRTNTLRRRAGQLGIALCLCVANRYAGAHEGHHHSQMPPGEPASSSAANNPPTFIASTAKPFADLMNDAMAVMDAGMRHAPMNGEPDHDFITMMMPHHQGAVDMAKAVLLYTKDPELRNLALGIITEQQNEIRVMQAWLKHHPARPAR